MDVLGARALLGTDAKGVQRLVLFGASTSGIRCSCQSRVWLETIEVQGVFLDKSRCAVLNTVDDPQLCPGKL